PTSKLVNGLLQRKATLWLSGCTKGTSRRLVCQYIIMFRSEICTIVHSGCCPADSSSKSSSGRAVRFQLDCSQSAIFPGAYFQFLNGVWPVSGGCLFFFSIKHKLYWCFGQLR